jgi:hypothetical protein
MNFSCRSCEFSTTLSSFVAVWRYIFCLFGLCFSIASYQSRSLELVFISAWLLFRSVSLVVTLANMSLLTELFRNNYLNHLSACSVTSLLLPYVRVIRYHSIDVLYVGYLFLERRSKSCMVYFLIIFHRG